MRALLSISGLLLVTSLVGCSGCQPDKVPEPAASSAAVPAPPPPQAAREERDRHVALQPDLCNQAAKRINELNGREPFDKKGVGVITPCLRYGNLAWYECVVEAQTSAAAKDCSQRLLVPPD